MTTTDKLKPQPDKLYLKEVIVTECYQQKQF